jgi:hypothetical protein
MDSAIQICVFTAFSLLPYKALMRRCCLIHLQIRWKVRNGAFNDPIREDEYRVLDPSRSGIDAQCCITFVDVRPQTQLEQIAA